LYLDITFAENGITVSLSTVLLSDSKQLETSLLNDVLHFLRHELYSI